MFTPFANEPLVNFADETPARKMQEALTRVLGDLGREYPLIIGGRPVETGDLNASRNPAKWSQVVGHASQAGSDHVDMAVQAATIAFRDWSRLTPEVRARHLMKAAAILRRRVYEFAAWMVYEASKSWAEAYADVAEAIDFLEYYAREAVRWGRPVPVTDYPGEENELRYVPLGAGAVISPWNFPLAIMAGMTSAAIAAGNTVIVKPAGQSPVTCAKFCELLAMASVPPGVVNFLPGPGATIGEALTGHPAVRFIAFTGSKEVGLRINQRAAIPQPGQTWLKRAVLEMGGKDAIVVDEDVNLDIAAEAIVTSAFGYQGQKCSACSRLIVHQRVHDKLLDKVVDKASKYTVGDPAVSTNTMGAVIDSDSYQKIMKYIAVGRTEGKVVLGGEQEEGGHEGGYFVHPTIFADVAPTARIAQEEIFGPVLAVIKASSFDNALEIANGTEFGLTGSVYSNRRAHLEKARQEFHVGNLYLNRKCTGALVGVQPFGGFNLSGTDSKAGGPDYLGLFLQAKSISERW